MIRNDTWTLSETLRTKVGMLSGDTFTVINSLSHTSFSGYTLLTFTEFLHPISDTVNTHSLKYRITENKFNLANTQIIS